MIHRGTSAINIGFDGLPPEEIEEIYNQFPDLRPKEDKMNLYEIVILEIPTEKEKKDGAKEQILIDTKILANDEQSAMLKCVMAEKEKIEDMDKISVLIRPFAN